MLIASAILLVAIIAVCILIGLQNSKKSSSANVNAILIISLNNSNKTYEYNGPGISALTLLQRFSVVKTTSSTYGAFVDCINNICSNNDKKHIGLIMSTARWPTQAQ